MFDITKKSLQVTGLNSFPSDLRHTFGHLDCPACEWARQKVIAKIVASMLFADGAALWLESSSLDPGAGAVQGRFIKANTDKSYRHYIESLDLFSGNLRLDQIHLGHLRQYQEARLAGAPPFIRKRRSNKNVIAGPCPASAKKVNQEMVILKKILRRANCWTQELDEYYEPLLETVSDVPRALEPNEQRRWLEVALLRREWWVVYWYSVLASETAMSTDEIRALRIGDLNLNHGIVNVREGKNKYRSRTRKSRSGPSRRSRNGCSRHRSMCRKSSSSETKQSQRKGQQHGHGSKAGIHRGSRSAGPHAEAR